MFHHGATMFNRIWCYFFILFSVCAVFIYSRLKVYSWVTYDKQRVYVRFYFIFSSELWVSAWKLQYWSCVGPILKQLDLIWFRIAFFELPNLFDLVSIFQNVLTTMFYSLRNNPMDLFSNVNNHGMTLAPSDELIWIKCCKLYTQNWSFDWSLKFDASIKLVLYFITKLTHNIDCFFFFFYLR